MKHNVLWIMTDQHRADCLGCMGNEHIQTPNLDRLGRGGIVFENAFCQSPVCMASRASLFTGRYPEAVRVRGMGILPPQETTFAELLQRNGYRTGAFGKTHFTPECHTREHLQSDVPLLDWRRFAADAHLPAVEMTAFKENYGFQVHVGCDDACQGTFHNWLEQVAPEYCDRSPTPVQSDAPHDTYVSAYPSECHQTTFIAKHAEAFIRQQNDASPWFAFCSFVAPHHPFEAPQDQIDRYDPALLPLPQLKGGVDIQNPPPQLSDAVSGEQTTFSETGWRQVIQHYYASISLVDENVGRLLEALAETGKAENTIVIFTSDHGEFLGNHGLLRKPSCHYDEVLRVPLLLRAPGLTAGKRISGLVELVDLYPTLCGLLDIKVNPGVQGRDWSGSLRRDKTVGRDNIYSDMYNMDPMVFAKGNGPYCACQTLRTEKWKLNVYPGAHLDCSQLFDLEDDPDESVNLFHKPECRDLREELLWRLLQRVHENVDPLPLRLRQW